MVLVRALVILAISSCFGGLLDATGYTIESSSISLTLKDSKSGLEAENVLFVEGKTTVVVDGIVWAGEADGSNSLSYETSVNGEVQAFGSITLSDDPLNLPSSVEAGEIVVKERGKTAIEVILVSGSSKSEGSTQVQTIATWMSAIPFIFAMIFSFFNSRRELTFLATIFLGSFIVEGSFGGGFVFAINDCLVEALSDISHAYM